MTSVIALTGGTGFIGRRFMDLIAARPDTIIRAMARDRSAIGRWPSRCIVEPGDMTDPAAFSTLLEEGCTWVNLAHPELPAVADYIDLMGALMAACRAKHVKRVVHCSTVAVAGRAVADVVTEETPCEPSDQYEVVKLAIERCLLREGGGSPEVVVLRPTAVFGPGGRNLVKLADELRHDSVFLNYFKSCLEATRRMNLVHVDNVAAALTFLVGATDRVAGEIFIVSDDDSPANNFRAVERQLMLGLGVADYAVPPVALPAWLLSWGLRLLGRSNINPRRVYDCSKIVGRGLQKPVPFERGLSEFAAWYGQHANQADS
jgi:nucleoside-diphosphate-sugar epimerase